MGKLSKTPDEIKKGLKNDCGECDEENFCPYIGISGCIGILHKDALSLIRQLEAQNAELLEKNKQLELERDALLEALRTNRHICNSCKHKPGHGYGCTSVAKVDGSCWEWRGLCEENTENI